MHPLLTKILVEGNTSLEDFQKLQRVPIEELPEMRLVRYKNLVWESFVRCKAEYQRSQLKLIKQGERMLKNPVVTRRRPTATTLSLPQPLLAEQEIGRDRAVVTLDDENLPGTSNAHSLVVPHLTEQESGIPAISFTSLEDLPAPSGIMESLLDQAITSAPIVPEEQLEISTLSIITADDHLLPSTEAPNAMIANDDSNLIQSITTNDEPRAGPSTEPLNGVSVVPIAPGTPTPLQQELDGLTLLPQRRKRKAARPPMTQIPYSHFYARPGRVDFRAAQEQLRCRPIDGSLIETLRELSLEEALRIGQIWLTGAPIPLADISPDLFPSQRQQSLPQAVLQAEESSVPAAALDMMEIVPDGTLNASVDVPSTTPVIDQLAVSTPDPETQLIPLAQFSSVNEDVSRISIDRHVEQSLERNMPSFISGQHTMTSLEQNNTARRMFAGEPAVEKIKFVQDLWTKLQTANRVPINEAIFSTDPRSDAAWKFGLLVEFDCQLWRMETVEGRSTPCAVCRWLK